MAAHRSLICSATVSSVSHTFIYLWRANHKEIITPHKSIFLFLVLPVRPRHTRSRRRVHVVHAPHTFYNPTGCSSYFFFLQLFNSFLTCHNTLCRRSIRCCPVIAISGTDETCAGSAAPGEVQVVTQPANGLSKQTG